MAKRCNGVVGVASLMEWAASAEHLARDPATVERSNGALNPEGGVAFDIEPRRQQRQREQQRQHNDSAGNADLSQRDTT